MTRFRPWHLLPLLLVAFVVITRLANAGTQVTAAPAAPQSDAQCFYPSADAYVYNQEPDTNFGSDDNLALSSFGDVVVQTRHSFLRFNLDAIPEGATVLAADLELYLDSADGSFTASLQAVDGNWGESTITWNNRPGRSGNFDNPTHSSTQGWKVWQADALVH